MIVTEALLKSKVTDVAQPISSQRTKATVLVVDDDPAVINLCTSLLKQAEFETLSADGSSEALKICKQYAGQIDLILTDLVMPAPAFQLASTSNESPHVHGHDLAMRAIRLRQGLRVIMMSGNPDKELASYGIKRGSFPFVRKPFELTAFLQTVLDVLQSPPPKLSDSASGTSGGDVEWVD
jgi:CheY-like chemotaxis protein